MAQNLRGLFRSQFRAGLNHTLEDYLSRLRTVWRTGHDADWEAGTYSPPTNMTYMPLSAISAETGTTAWIHEQRAAHDIAGDFGRRPRVGHVTDRCRALDDGTGEVLVEVNLGSPVRGFPSPT